MNRPFIKKAEDIPHYYTEEDKQFLKEYPFLKITQSYIDWCGGLDKDDELVHFVKERYVSNFLYLLNPLKKALIKCNELGKFEITEIKTKFGDFLIYHNSRNKDVCDCIKNIELYFMRKEK